MKIRSGYVSNSSSSSFIINKDLTDVNINCIKLTTKQLKKVVKRINKTNQYFNDPEIEVDITQDWYLTELLCHGCNNYSFIVGNEDDVDRQCNFIEHSYMEGGHGIPYYGDQHYKVLEKNGNKFYLFKKHKGDIDED